VEGQARRLGLPRSKGNGESRSLSEIEATAKKQQQIPYGDDNKKSDDNSRSSRFAEG
jgi:hypothetical protein